MNRTTCRRLAVAWFLSFVAMGAQAADVTGADGRRLRTLVPGDTFGEIGLIRAGRRSATVTASGPLVVLMLFTRKVIQINRIDFFRDGGFNHPSLAKLRRYDYLFPRHPRIISTS